MLAAKDLVLDHLGEDIILYRGGMNRITGKESQLITSTIIVVDGDMKSRKYREPALTNAALFQRDRYLCAYCGKVHKSSELTRDHYQPVSKGGQDTWMNVLSACKDCNSMKSDLLPGQRLPNRMPGPQGNGLFEPLFVPYVPCRAEAMILRNRGIKADQMLFLLERVKNKKSRIFDYAKDLFPSMTV
jgi:5-methylcytosine-specific restriction endonuclease McrA